MAYTVLKPINLGGKRRLIGEMLDAKEVVLERAACLVKSGYLAQMQTMPEMVQVSETQINSNDSRKRSQKKVIPDGI